VSEPPSFRFSIAPWERLSADILLDNDWLTLRRDRCALPDGRVVADYYVVEEPDVACVVALTPARNVLLVEQYKHGIGRVCLEIPGGSFDAADGAPLMAAQRELREETGFESAHWLPLGVLPVSPARTTVQMHLFAALDCVRVAEQKLDPQEAITVHSVPMHEIMPLVHAGLIDASTTVSGLLLAFDHLRARGLLE
jgi:8-oxo-dGTP pyrophosphatase MutT (NUDIX family)